MIRIVAISDTHSRHRKVTVPEGDLLIHAGDATMMGTVKELAEFNRWLGELPHPQKIVCAGNHDWLFEKSPALACSMMTNALYLEDESTTVLGLRIYASPWQPRFYDWAFNLDRGVQLRRKWEMIPEGLDVLITHGPPRGILDRNLNGEEAGCDDLLTAVFRVRPRIHIFGHIHEGYGEETREGIRFINASICNADYRIGGFPIVIDIEPLTPPS